ncbi:MAG: hypothetical protein DRN01_04665 [Thermoplasmata archaeon]|nr:MAG: hypothetical protein DRN01_04665 [Thermoplasmata archaeon]
MRKIMVFSVIITLMIIPYVIETSLRVTADTKTSYSGSSFLWEDDFFDEGGIDKTHSWNYVVDKINGTVYMKNTCPAWYNSSWKRMKPILITNTGTTSFEDYVLNLTVYYDTDMQEDFDDLRFTDTDGNNIPYWIGEKVLGESANVLVRVPEIPAENTTTIYMFYGDSNASDRSDFDMIFTWDDRTDPDLMISYKNYLEGAWDPDVAFGENKFLVVWEEGLGPEDLQNQWHRLTSRQIHGRLYDSDGKNPYPDPQDDLDLYISSNPDDTSYHAENPSIAFGDNVFFVAWEENRISDGRWAVDIKGALLTSDGQVTKRFTICNANLGQYDPCVAFGNHRFMVVWEDARDGSNNYDVYGRIYDTNGNPVGQDFAVADGANYQGQPWVCSDDEGYFMVVYENGYDPVVGPFSIYAMRYDSDGNPIASPIHIAEGDDDADYIFPAVAFCPKTERYFVSWNDGDVSVNPNDRSSYDGNVWGKILDRYGNTVCDNFIVQHGDQYIRTDVKPYLGTLFFVSYDGGSDIWGVLVSSDGRVQTKEHMISDGSSQNTDWNNLAVGAGNIFSVWEDERDQTSDYPDAFGSVWHIYRATGSPDVTYEFEEEKEQVLYAELTSKEITPVDLIAWHDFHAKFMLPTGFITFSILDENYDAIPEFENISSGKDLALLDPVQYPKVRLHACFERKTPEDTPFLDKWNISWIGLDNTPPRTTINLQGTEGENGWYRSNIQITLDAFDDGSGVNKIYYKVDNGEQQVYTHPVTLTEEGVHTLTYWSVDNAGNEEQHHTVTLKIDKHDPTVHITKPDESYVYINDFKKRQSFFGWTLIIGDITVEAFSEDSLSGINKVEFYLDGVSRSTITGEQQDYRWRCTESMLFVHLIMVKAYDNAGNTEDSEIFIVAFNL